MKSVFANIWSWIIIPAIVIYGYYFDANWAQNIIVFYMWIMFILEIFVILFLLFLVGAGKESDHIKLDGNVKTDKEKLMKLIKWDKKLNSKFWNFQTNVGRILYTGLSVLIASTGAIWTAIVFFMVVVFGGIIIMELVKALYKIILPSVIDAAKDLQVKEILDMIEEAGLNEKVNK